MQNNNKEIGDLNKELGDSPVEFKCPFCHSHSYTQIEYQNSLTSYLIALMLVILTGISACLIVLPMSLLLTRTLKHKCQACLAEVGGNGEIFYGTSIKDKMMSLHFGEMGFIFSRRIFIRVTSCFIIIFLVYFKIGFIFYQYKEENYTIVHPNYTKWEQFLEQCNYEQINKSQNNYLQCQKQYQEQTFMDWKGWVIRINDNRNSLYQYFSHAVTILVQMDTQESKTQEDFLITIDSYQAKDYDEILQNIDRGNQLSFNVTLKGLGNYQQSRHFHANNLNIVEGQFKEIQPFYNEKTRYNMRKNTNLKQINNENILEKENKNNKDNN